MKCWRCLAIAATAILLIALAVVVSGLVPARASSGHWPLTAWALEFAMERSVSTGSVGIESPPLDSEALIMRGAGHYEVGCAWCHGRPPSGPGRIVLQMTPHPSVLQEELNKWSSEELFYIVRHGVKFTGMPAWPAPKRDDEVWAMVAFLKQFDSLDESRYQHLAGLDERQQASRQRTDGQTIPKVVIEQCVSCHGINGQGRDAFPTLAGQKAAYLHAALISYRNGNRPSGTMGPVAAELTDDEVRQIVDYYASLPPRSQAVALDEEQETVARQLISAGDTRRRVGACQACHPLNSDKSPDVELSYPRLNGQRVGYLINQLYLFRKQHRGGGRQHHIMHNLAEELTDEQIRAVAWLYSAQ